MKKYFIKILLLIPLFIPSSALAASNEEVGRFTNDALNTLMILASIATVFFLIKGAYSYITSSGNPAALENAKKTIRNALIGLVVVIGAAVFSSILNGAMLEPSNNFQTTTLELNQVEAAPASGSLTQILLDSVSGFLQNIISSSAKPIVDGIIRFLTQTPSLATNSVVFNFWLIIVGITDSLFALGIALIGFHIMSAETFGFENIDLKEIWPRIIFYFLLANTSIFWIDWIISLNQTLVSAVLNSTGGLSSAWILNAFDPAALLSGTTLPITLIFALIFILLAVVLLIFYISRLMILAFGAVISPLVCLLSLSPKMADFVGNATKIYFITVFTVFLHVIIIQLSSAFLTVPGQSGSNPLISILVGIALLCVLLKSTSITIQLAMSSQAGNTLRKMSTQIINVISSKSAKTETPAAVKTAGRIARAK